MKIRQIKIQLALCFSLVVVVLCLPVSSSYSEGEDVHYKIGVLANRGSAQCLRKWSQTAEYLSEKIQGASFAIISLSYDELHDAVMKNQIDFLIANSAIYVEFEAEHGIQRMATLENMRMGDSYTLFGGVVFYKKDRLDIKTLKDLKNKSFAAVARNSFGGWIMALREFKHSGINPGHDFSKLVFLGTHDAVVNAVLDGTVDAGTVRTDTLERMDREGEININDFSIIHDHVGMKVIAAIEDYKAFPFLHSTRLYPEWPFSKLNHIEQGIAEEVFAALLIISPKHPVAIAGEYSSWTIPLNYQLVRECLMELRIEPYQDYGKITLKGIIAQYFIWIISISILLFLIIIALGYVVFLNSKLKHSNEKIELSYAQLKRIESNLRESKTRYKYLFENTRDIIAITDLKGNIIAINKTIEQNGFKREDIFGKNRAEFIAQEYHQQVLDNLEQLKSGKVTYGQIEMITPKGRLSVEYSDIPIIEGDKITGVQSVLRDITHRKELENTQRLAQLGRFVAAMAHEVNNPLMIISGRAQLASMEDIQNEEVMKNLDIVMKECQRAKDIINRLLRFAKTSKKNTGKIEVNKTLNETINILEHQFSLEGVIINCNYTDNLPQVVFNEKQLQEVLMNLLTNSRDAIVPGKGVIDVKTFIEDDNVKIEVHDSGRGIDKETLEKIYEPFFTTKEKGTGLGLSVCHGTIIDHGGQLKITSVSGVGTKVIIILPAA